MLELPPPPRPTRSAETIPLKVVFEDDEIIVIDKPAGLVVHPAAGNRSRHAGQRADRPLRREPVRHRRRQAARHRAPPRQGHHRPDGGGQDRPRASRARRAVRRPRPHGPLERGYLAFVWGAPDRPRGTDRRADRPPPARPRQDGGARGAAARRSPIGRCSSASRRRRQAGREPCSPAGSRPAAPTRSASTSPISAIRCSATPSTAPASGPRRPARRPGRAPRSRPLAGRPCMPICSASNTPEPAKSWSSARNCRTISRRLRDEPRVPALTGHAVRKRVGQSKAYALHGGVTAT